MATRYLPVLVGTPDAGLIVDRHDKRHVLMVTNTALGLTSLAIGAAVLTTPIAMWQIFTPADRSRRDDLPDNATAWPWSPNLSALR